jgi:hypothetical protein
MCLTTQDVLSSASEEAGIFSEQKTLESPMFLALENLPTIFESQQVTPAFMS